MLKELGISKSYFKRTMPTVSGSSSSFTKKTRLEGGRKMSLYQQKLFLKEMLERHRELTEEMDEQKEHIKEDQPTKSGMMMTEESADYPKNKEALEGMIKSVFDRNS